MDERELVLTSLIYPLIFREAAQIGIATPVSAHIRELLKIQTPEPEVIRVGNATPVSALIRNIFQNYEHPLQDFAQIGIAIPHSAYIKNIFNEHPQPIEAVTQIGIATPVSAHHVNLLKNLQTFKTDHVVQVSNAIPEAVYSTCKPVVFAPTYLGGQYNGESIQLYWTNSSITHSHQNLYRSTTPFTESNLPPVYQYIFRGINSYIDEDVVEGVTYYYAVSTEAGLVQLVSDVIEVITQGGADPQLPEVIGEEFGGGFYIGDITIPDGPDAGTYAIIMAGTVGQVTIQWKIDRTATTGTSSTVDGMANTLAMEAADLAAHPAAKHCREYAGDGHDDWYLPSKDELNLAWVNRGVLAGLGMEAQWYWSSTEYSANFTWNQIFNSGNQSHSYKNYRYRVRPVRRIRKT